MPTEHIYPPLGRWRAGDCPPEPLTQALAAALLDLRRPVYIVERDGRLAVGAAGTAEIGREAAHANGSFPLRAYVPPLPPSALGDPAFKAERGLEYAYVVGEMANAITSVEMVTEAGTAGMLGFFGAGGLVPAQVEEAVDRLQQLRPRIAFGVNLIHSPGNPELEMALVDMFLRRGVRLVSASAYVEPTLALTYYRVKGLRREADGGIVRPHTVVGKVSRVEVARKFLSPPPPRLVAQLLERGLIDRGEAELAGAVPLVEDLTAEADSAGHTDNRPAITLLPTMIALRDELCAANGFRRPPCVGLGGGIATPQAVAAAFALGAAYVVTGSVNQCCVEAGTSEAVCSMLAEAGQADVAMAPSADMFELGVKVQVLKRGTMFPLPRRQALRALHRPRGLRRGSRPGSARRWSATCCGAPSSRSGSRPDAFSSSATPGRWSAPKRTPSTKWLSCSAPTSAARPCGPSPASPRAGSTTRSGAARPWAPSTSGRAAAASNGRKAAARSRWP